MQKTKIEWVVNPDGSQGYTWNVIKGYCPNDCSYCYAHRMYNRFKWDKTIRFDWHELRRIEKIKKPSKIFVGSTIEMYHPNINELWVGDILFKSREYPQHTYITLTKFPENLYKFDFPENWWLGYSTEGDSFYYDLEKYPPNIRFVSIEPLLYEPDYRGLLNDIPYLDWIIIGGLTPKPVHKIEWIDDIVSRADKLNIPVYIKDNANYNKVRKFFPDFKL